MKSTFASRLLALQPPSQGLAVHANHAGMPSRAATCVARLPFVAGEQAGQHATAMFAVYVAITGVIDCTELEGDGGTAGTDCRRVLALRLQHGPVGKKMLRIAW